MKKSRVTIKPSNLTFTYVAILVGMVVLYLYFLNTSVVHVVMRTQHVQDQNRLSVEIAKLEAKYIESQHIIAARIASTQSYNIDTPKIFVSREQATLVLRDN